MALSRVLLWAWEMILYFDFLFALELPSGSLFPTLSDQMKLFLGAPALLERQLIKLKNVDIWASWLCFWNCTVFSALKTHFDFTLSAHVCHKDKWIALALNIVSVACIIFWQPLPALHPWMLYKPFLWLHNRSQWFQGKGSTGSSSWLASIPRDFPCCCTQPCPVFLHVEFTNGMHPPFHWGPIG